MFKTILIVVYKRRKTIDNGGSVVSYAARGKVSTCYF